MKVLGLIPARGGSRGIPRKNLALLAGSPLLAYTANAALAAKSLSRVVLSTEDEEIAEVGRRLRLDVPFLRPAELARDETPTLPVVQHALRTLERDDKVFDAVCLLQPTAPLRSTEDIDACIALFRQQDADCVITVLPVPCKFNPHWVYLPDEDGSLQLATGETSPIPRRQELPPAFHRDGSVYVTRRDVILAGSLYGRRVFGYPSDPDRAVNIDTPQDLRRAEQRLESVQARGPA